MDVSRDRLRAVILGHEGLFEAQRDDTESWGEAIRREPPRLVSELPEGQWKAACYGSDDRTVYVTCEGIPTRLLAIRPTGESRSPREAD